MLRAVVCALAALGMLVLAAVTWHRGTGPWAELGVAVLLGLACWWELRRSRRG